MIDSVVKKLFVGVSVILIVILIFGVFLFFNGKPQTQPASGTRERIGVGIVTTDDLEIEKHQKFVDYLNAHSDHDWYLVPLKDYGSYISQLELGQIKSGFMGSAVAYRAIRNGLALPVARGEKDGVSSYYSYIFVKKADNIESIEELKGKRFAYVDISTSAGFVYPVYLLRSKGYDPDDFFSAPLFAGTHEKAILAVLNRDYDGGAAKDLAWKKLALKNPDLEKKLKIIEKEGPFPENTFMVGTEFGTKEVEELRSLLLNFGATEDGQELLAKMNLDRFIITEEKDFDVVKKISD